MSNHSRSHLYCSNCGVRLKGVQDLCPSCGKPLDETLLYENIEQVGAGGIGYSSMKSTINQRISSFPVYRAVL